MPVKILNSFLAALFVMSNGTLILSLISISNLVRDNKSLIY